MVKATGKKLNTIERKKAILTRLYEKGNVNIAELSQELGASLMTIRRDLTEFQSQGILHMEYGGAVLNNRSLLEYNMSEKQEQKIEEKKEIARKSLEYIGEDQTLFLDAGTTVNELAKLIVNKHKLNVVTNSLLVANTLAGAENIRLIICPGVFREKSMAVMGQLTDQFVNMFSIDIMFLGVEGVNLNDGITVPDIADGTTKHNVQIRAKKTICLADSTKFKKSYFFRICDVTDVNTIITGKGLSNKIAEEYQEAGINLIRV